MRYFITLVFIMFAVGLWFGATDSIKLTKDAAREERDAMNQFILENDCRPYQVQPKTSKLMFSCTNGVVVVN